jgi:ribosomal protein S18 acetylase RimI-like enzyme
MTCSDATFDVRPCRWRDVANASRMLKASWHATYDSILGERLAVERGRWAYSTGPLKGWVVQSKLSPHSTRMLIATQDGMAAGLATAQLDASGIVLWMLYVDPERKGKGIGTALLQAAIDGFAGAKSIRVEVLRGNVAAIAWYKARGFEVYGEARNATGTPGIAAVYLDKKLDRLPKQG